MPRGLLRPDTDPKRRAVGTIDRLAAIARAREDPETGRKIWYPHPRRNGLMSYERTLARRAGKTVAVVAAVGGLLTLALGSAFAHSGGVGAQKAVHWGGPALNLSFAPRAASDTTEPDETETPEATDAPEVTEAPDETDAPEATHAPKATESDQGHNEDAQGDDNDDQGDQSDSSGGSSGSGGDESDGGDSGSGGDSGGGGGVDD
jgi:uncharacterized membrane protein YgcG